ncbi:hypothetical protein FA15DRAFT_572087, partial [Coprinopsis marcescibilis]
VLYYDYLITFGDEIEFIWKQKFRISTILYIFCRYGLFANVLYVLSVNRTVDGLEVRTPLLARTYHGCSFEAPRSHASSNSMLLSLISHLNPAVRGTLTSLTIVYEFIAFVLATYKGYMTMRVDGPVWSQRKSLNYLVFTQGTQEGISGLSIGAMVLNFDELAVFFQRLLNGLKIPLSGFLTARFLLRLRIWKHRSSQSRTTSV